jgi:hypothetical protein
MRSKCIRTQVGAELDAQRKNSQNYLFIETLSSEYTKKQNSQQYLLYRNFCLGHTLGR